MWTLQGGCVLYVIYLKKLQFIKGCIGEFQSPTSIQNDAIENLLRTLYYYFYKISLFQLVSVSVTLENTGTDYTVCFFGYMDRVD